MKKNIQAKTIAAEIINEAIAESGIRDNAITSMEAWLELKDHTLRCQNPDERANRNNHTDGFHAERVTAETVGHDLFEDQVEILPAVWPSVAEKPSNSGLVDLIRTVRIVRFLIFVWKRFIEFGSQK